MLQKWSRMHAETHLCGECDDGNLLGVRCREAGRRGAAESWRRLEAARSASVSVSEQSAGWNHQTGAAWVRVTKKQQLTNEGSSLWLMVVQFCSLQSVWRSFQAFSRGFSTLRVKSKHELELWVKQRHLAAQPRNTSVPKARARLPVEF